MVANYIDKKLDITVHSENGFLGLGPTPKKEIKDLVNAGGEPVTILPGGVFFDSATSFGIVRGDHIDVSVLGGLQVDQNGNIANWMIPGKMVLGMGGAMDLLSGAKKVIVAMEHTAKGKPKILKKCTMPLTGTRKVNLIITEMCVIEYTDKGLVLKEIAPNVTLDDIKAVTEAKLIIHDNIPIMKV